ncbi:MAG: putative lipid II flippase FtsW [Candidatus Omnitrophica bacterium]|nr:putative lipid II flippase FtsW [Candidatus Omnitrophota bacterium]
MRNIRRSIFIIMIALLTFGCVMIYSASAIHAHENYSDSMYFLKRHLIFLLLGFGLMIFLMSVDISRLERAAKPLMIASLALLALVLIPNIGSSVAGARRWFRAGPLSFQPSELAKFALVIYIASYLDRKGYKIKDFFYGFLPIVSVISLTGILVLCQPDLGTSLSVFFIGFLMLFVGGASVLYLGSIALLSLPFLYYLIFSVPYRRRRILVFLDPWRDSEGAGFQIVQSFIALGSGGLLGVGLGQSTQKLFYLPESYTDFIFSIVGEELGFLGAASLVLLFGVFIWQGMRAVFFTESIFKKTLLFGVTGMIAFEVLINIGVSSGLFPTKGLPLPFISYGGSSLLFHMGAAGIMLNAMRE